MDGAIFVRAAEDSFPVVWNLGPKTETQVYQDPSHRRLHFPLEIPKLSMTSAQRPFCSPVTAGKFPCNLMFFVFVVMFFSECYRMFHYHHQHQNQEVRKYFVRRHCSRFSVFCNIIVAEWLVQPLK